MSEIDEIRECHQPSDGDNDAGIVYCLYCGDVWGEDGCDTRVVIAALDTVREDCLAQERERLRLAFEGLPTCDDHPEPHIRRADVLDLLASSAAER